MLRRLAVIFLMILCSLVATGWWRSHTLGEIIGIEGRDAEDFVTRIDGILSGGGQIAVGRLQVEHPRELAPGGWYQKPVVRTLPCWRRDFVPYPFLDETARPAWKILGFGRRGIQSGTITRRLFTGIGVPYWLLLVATGALPTYVLVTTTVRLIRRAERSRLRCCLNCGYDLRASGGRCPECGHSTTPR